MQTPPCQRYPSQPKCPLKVNQKFTCKGKPKVAPLNCSHCRTGGRLVEEGSTGRRGDEGIPMKQMNGEDFWKTAILKDLQRCSWGLVNQGLPSEQWLPKAGALMRAPRRLCFCSATCCLITGRGVSGGYRSVSHCN